MTNETLAQHWFYRSPDMLHKADHRACAGPITRGAAIAWYEQHWGGPDFIADGGTCWPATEATVHWDKSGPAVRLAVVELIWFTRKGKVTRLGQRIAETAWADLSPAAQNVLAWHGVAP